MKLRIRDDSLRLRLGQTEVAGIAAGEPVAGSMHLPDGSVFGYRLVGVAGVAADVRRDAGGLTVCIDNATLRDWAASDGVSLSAVCHGPVAPLELLVEKDFACLTERAGDDDSDSFPHPEAGSAAC